MSCPVPEEKTIQSFELVDIPYIVTNSESIQLTLSEPEYQILPNSTLEHLTCYLCSTLLRHPRTLICCGTSICVDCLEINRIQDRLTSTRVTCPRCRIPSRIPLTNSATIEKIISDVFVQCPNNSCPMNHPLGTLDNHFASCSFSSILCGNLNCNWSDRREAYKQHQEECAYRTLKCLKCDKIIHIQDKQSHSSSCEGEIESCSHSGCSFECRRSHMVIHEVMCPFRIMECIGKVEGCSVSLPQIELLGHESTCPKALSSYFPQSSTEQETHSFRFHPYQSQ